MTGLVIIFGTKTGSKSLPEKRLDAKETMRCQLTDIRDIAQKVGPARRLSNIRVRLLRKLKNAGVRVLKQTLGDDTAGSDHALPDRDESLSIRPGDTVQVRSRAEIRSLLSGGGKTKGCSFTHEMYKYCGREFRVLKSVETFFDESKQKMCKCRDTVLLDGAVCSGRQRLYFMKCDRNCFFFWQTVWLRKVR